jgi:nicotinate-nucleotide adenylyltransferase
MKIALFGGSFDPPHVAHQMACLYVLQTYDVDELWMVPCYQHPFDKRMAPYAHRVAMCRLAAAPLGPRVLVSTIEEELGGPSYTLTTVRALTARHPEHEFFLTIGADLLRERERWHGAAELLETVRFIVLGRAGAQGGPLREGSDLHHPDSPDLPAISSTLVRKSLFAGEEPHALVSRSVLFYIREHGLYRPGDAGSAETESNDKDAGHSGKGTSHVAV